MAANLAGFRESGLQSLKCLIDSSSYPVVAVRTNGLAMASIIGYLDETSKEGKPTFRSMVSEEYLGMLIKQANERFIENDKRIKRFMHNLGYQILQYEPAGKVPSMESKDERRHRKRTEGLSAQARIRQREAEAERFFLNKFREANLERPDDEILPSHQFQ